MNLKLNYLFNLFTLANCKGNEYPLEQSEKTKKIKEGINHETNDAGKPVSI